MNAVAEKSVELRPFREEDLAFIDRLVTDPTCSEPFQWFGFSSPQTLRRRWEEDGFLGKDPHHLAVVRSDSVIGWVMWRKGSRTSHSVWRSGRCSSTMDEIA
jgi:hypothetical protein